VSGLARGTLTARSAKLDIATFEVDPAKLPEMGAVPFDCRRNWPPTEVNEGDTLTLAGYLDTRRNNIDAPASLSHKRRAPRERG